MRLHDCRTLCPLCLPIPISTSHLSPANMLEDPTAKQWRILVVGALVVLLIDFGGFLSIPAQTEIFQDIICRHYYATYSVVPEADGDCKVAFVQSELAAVNGWKDTFDALPSIRPWPRSHRRTDQP